MSANLNIKALVAAAGIAAGAISGVSAETLGPVTDPAWRGQNPQGRTDSPSAAIGRCPVRTSISDWIRSAARKSPWMTGGTRSPGTQSNSIPRTAIAVPRVDKPRPPGSPRTGTSLS